MYPIAVSGAEAKTYQVEILIFTNENGTVANGGVPARPLIVAQEATALMKRADSADFQRLPDTELSLATAKSILEQSGAYNVVEHVAWRQPGLGEDAARAVRIHGGMDYQYTPIASPLLGQVNEGDNLDIATPEPMTLPQLDGTVTVTLNQYLHVHTDFVLRTFLETPTIGINQRLKSARSLYQYRIQQDRRMRSRQLHYFDHPLLGILVHITPVEPEPSNQQPAPAREQKPGSKRLKIPG